LPLCTGIDGELVDWS